jgi:hypothetical protein
MKEFPLWLKLGLFAIEVIIFLTLMVKSGKLATSEEESFLREKRTGRKPA